MDPAARVTMRPSSAGAGGGSRCAARNLATSSSVSRPSRSGTARDRIVGSIRDGSALVSTNVVSAGGSSRSLSSALAASGFASCGTSRSASPMTKTFRLPSTGVRAAFRAISRAVAIPCAESPSGGRYIGVALGEHFGDRLRRLLHLLVRLRRLGAGNRDDPVQVRVSEPQHQPTAPTVPTGLRSRPLTVEQLSDPQGQTLLPNACGTGQEEHLG